MSEQKTERELKLEKKIALLKKKLNEISDEKVTLEIEVDSLKAEVGAWKNKHQVLSENVGRMLKKPEGLSKEIPLPKTLRGSSRSEDEILDELRDRLGEVVVEAIERDLIRKGSKMKLGTSRN